MHGAKNRKSKSFKAPSRGGETSQARLGLFAPSNVPAGASLSDCIKLGREGYIKLYRIIQDHPIKKDHPSFLLFLHLLCDAEFVDGAQRFFLGKQITLKRGQLTCGRYELSRATGLPPSTVRNTLKRLQSKWQIVDYQSDTHYSLITILNYDRYQNSRLKKDYQEDNDRTPIGQQVDTLEEVKNVRIKELKNKDIGHERPYQYPIGVFKRPSLDDVKAHIGIEKESTLFFNYYESNGWKVGKNPMKNWKAAATGWLSRNGIKKQRSEADFPVGEYFEQPKK